MKKIDKKIFIIIGLILLIIIEILVNINSNKKEEVKVVQVEKTTQEVVVNDTFFVDVKGSVKKPGVYEFKDNERVIDAINKAGGLKTNADTSNINLSQKLKSEMVVYVYSKTEIKNASNKISCDTKCSTNVIEVNNCTTKDEKNLININTASESELLTLPGVGEAKAKSIIEYRNNNGGFKSIEDIKNISGIADSLFNQIKDMITV